MNAKPAGHDDDPVETLYEGPWLRMLRRGRWEYVERTTGESMAVIVIAVTPDDKLLFVEQFRVPLGAPTIEMPAAWSATTTIPIPSKPPPVASSSRKPAGRRSGWKCCWSARPPPA